MEGLVIFNKPKDISSYKVVEFFQKKLKKKVGHGGTLDKLAEGILILGIDKYTKELDKFLKHSIKTYIAEIKLGAKSTTYDKEGEIIYLADNRIKDIKDEEIIKVIENFIGEIEQIPPKFSALKIKGRPAYLLARKKEDFEIKPRKARIYDIKILEIRRIKENLKKISNRLLVDDSSNILTSNQAEFIILKIEVICSSGTYIRSLANDIGEKLGIGGYINDLKRIKINEFSIEEALTFEDINKNFLEFYSLIYGNVQGVGFRFFSRKWAKNFKIKGYAKNLSNGAVEILSQGEEEKLQNFILQLKKGPPLAKVEKIEIIFRKPKEIYNDFLIL